MSVTQLPFSEITFLVRIPANTPGDQPIYLSILDEVTGLQFNPRNIILQSLDAENYGVTITAPVGSVLKYRYSHGIDAQIGEYTTFGQPVRYRMHLVDGPGLVTDIVSRWGDTLFVGSTGRISGSIQDAQSSAPIPGAMVVAGGVYDISAADGSFRLEGLPTGKHQLVVLALDGKYRTFNQEAIVASESQTPVIAKLQPNTFVDVTFNLIVPPDTVPTVPVKIAGNLLQLGNTYGDLAGGVSVLATHMPTLQGLGGGRYTLTLSLPIGVDLRYKYTMGDGIWNAEHSEAGGFLLRQLIIPEGVESYTVEDVVLTWQSTDSNPIWFDVSVPLDTPETDDIYLQFRLQTWMEPVSMWPVGENRWGYQLTSPTNFSEPVQYRFCRNAQCGDMPGVAIGETSATNQLDTNTKDAGTLITAVDRWKWFSGQDTQAIVLSNAIHLRGPDFVAGVAFSQNYHPSWARYLDTALQDIKSINANSVVLTPTWSFTQQNPPLISQIPGKDILWPALIQMSQQVNAEGLKAILMPQVKFPIAAEDWWLEAPRDFPWWQVWFEQYRIFILHHAELAQQQNIDMFILGGSAISPALPDGILSNGSSSNVPEDAQERWEALIFELHTRFSGKIAWALTYPEGIAAPPPFLDFVDVIYLQWSAPIASEDDTSTAEMETTAGRLFDKDVLPFQLQLDKPIIIAVSYPSATGGSLGCVPSPEGGCIPFQLLSAYMDDLPTASLDLNEQMDVYNAILSAVNERAWISGLVAEGYYPPVQLVDKSTSIHGKPAEKVLWYWYGKMLGVN